jgi:hypothetical protein
MLVPTCNLGRYLSAESIEDRQAAFCEKIRKEVLRYRLREYHGVGSFRRDYEAPTGGTRSHVAPKGESEDPMFFLVYVSSATRPFSGEDLRALLETCRKNNAGLGVTGMLL